MASKGAGSVRGGIALNASSWEDLIEAARKASGRSYSPYSGLAVGAAVRTTSGQTYVGANIENASFGLSICAERLAVFRAVAESQAVDADGLIEAVVAVDGEGNVLSPCGACRQVIFEFGSAAEVRLPSGVRSIGNALADPFEKGALGGGDPASGRAEGAAVAKVFGRSEQDRVQLMRFLMKMRQGAAEMYEEVSRENTRAALFVREGEYLVIPPGFFSNFENPEERTIRIQLGYGITGGAFASNGPNFGVPCSDGALHSDPLPPPEQGKVDGALKWVVAWPLAGVGAVSVDGFDEIDKRGMRGISESNDLKKIVERIDLLLNG